MPVVGGSKSVGAAGRVATLGVDSGVSEAVGWSRGTVGAIRRLP